MTGRGRLVPRNLGNVRNRTGTSRPRPELTSRKVVVSRMRTAPNLTVLSGSTSAIQWAYDSRNETVSLFSCDE